MFNTGGTSAYGKGITSNLVSDEQRQRFNYGGRVKLGYGSPWEDYAWQRGVSAPGQTIDQSYATYNLPYGSSELHEVTKGRAHLEPPGSFWAKAKAGLNFPFLEEAAASTVDEESEDVEAQDIYQGSDPRFFTRKSKKEDWGDSDYEAGGEQFIKDEKKIDEEDYERGEHWKISPEMPEKEKKRDDTDLLDTPDKWAFLDEYEAKKKKQGRGQALWEGAAAAIDWGTAGTAKERSKAISTGLRKVGAIGAKYKGEAMDLRAKAKILGAIEEEKQKGKIDVQTMKETGLGERHKNLIAHYKSLQDDPDKTQFDIYKTLIQTQEGTTGVRMGKVLRAMAEGKRPVADAFDFTNEEQLKNIKDGTIVVSLEGVTGIKDSSEEDGIKEVGIEEILESLR